MSAIIDALRPKKAKKKATTGISSDAEDAKPVKESQGAPSSEAVFNGDETPKLGDEGVMGTDGVIRQRGPVEEVISKRARQLLKKIQRFKAYASQTPESLNADQRAAVASLPTLESAYNELQELIKPGGTVEVAELNESGKLRAARDEAVKSAEAAASSRVAEYEHKLVTPLSLFLRLYAVLHPARPSDQEHLTFGRLVLPAQLQDEVQATDVLRVGRMYEDLISGGETAKAVLAGLVKGPLGEDVENDHVHHLLHLLTFPEQPASFPPTNAASEQEYVEPSEANEDIPSGQAEILMEIIPPTSIVESRGGSEYGLVNGHGYDAGHGMSKSVEVPRIAGSGGMLNFLQEDELVPAALQDDSFEVVPRMQPHETSGLQPPAEAPTTYSPPQATDLPGGSASFNWADEHDDDFPESTQPPSAEAKIDEQVIPSTESKEDSRPAVALVQEKEATLPQPTEAVDSPTFVESSEPPAESPVPVPETAAAAVVGRGFGGRGRTPRDARDGRKREGQGKQRAARVERPREQEKDRESRVVVDADGFEMKIRRALPPTRGGRGGRGGAGGEFRGGRGGTGGASGRGGRGGPLKGGPRTAPSGNVRARKDGVSPTQAQGEQQQQQAPKPKPSIFKPIGAAATAAAPAQTAQ